VSRRDDVVLVGPASPSALADLFTGTARTTAAQLSGLGGVPVNSLARALLDAGCQVEIVTLDRDVGAPLTIEEGRLRILVAPYRSRGHDRARDLYAAERRGLAALLTRTDGSLLHAHWTYEFALPCFGDGRPTAVTAHDSPLGTFRLMPSRYRAVRTAVGVLARLRIAHLSTVSPTLATRWRREMLYRRPIAVIPNVVQGTGADGRRPQGDEASAPLLLDIAEGDDHKNVRALVRAFPGVLDAHPDARLRLIGPGLGGDSVLAGWARSCGLDRQVEFIGPVPWNRLGGHLSETTVFVHPSLDESFSLSICEAMHAHVPVVAGRHAGAVPWTVGAGGLLVDITDPAAIRSAVLRLLADPQLRRAVGDAAAARVRTAFAPEVVAPRYLEWYAAVRRDEQRARSPMRERAVSP
jgi:glycosyltransferase involved in cell wall biosynthesis